MAIGKLNLGIHEKKLTYMAFIVGILVMVWFNPYGVGWAWAAALVILMVWYGWMSKRKAKQERWNDTQ